MRDERRLRRAEERRQHRVGLAELRRRHGRGRPRRSSGGAAPIAARIAATPSAWASTPSPVGSSRPMTQRRGEGARAGDLVAAAAARRRCGSSRRTIGAVASADRRCGLHGAAGAITTRLLAGTPAPRRPGRRDDRRRVADAGELVQARLRAARRHRRGRRRREDVGVGAAQDAASGSGSRRTRPRARPRRRAAIGRRDRAQRHADRRVVVQAEAIAVAAQHRPRQRQPLLAACAGRSPARSSAGSRRPRPRSPR